MGSRPPLRRAPSRSPPPTSSNSATPSTTGKIIRLSQRPADTTPSPSRADVTPIPKPIRPPASAGRLIRRRPSPDTLTSRPPALPPPAWKRRITPDPSKPPDEPKKPEDDKAETVTEPIKPQPPKADREVEAIKVVDAPDPSPDLEMIDASDKAEEEVDAVLESVIGEGVRLMQASSDWIGEALGGVREDVVLAVEIGGPTLGRVLNVIVKELLDPFERHVKVIGDAVDRIEVLVDRLKREAKEDSQ